MSMGSCSSWLHCICCQETGRGMTMPCLLCSLLSPGSQLIESNYTHRLGRPTSVKSLISIHTVFFFYQMILIPIKPTRLIITIPSLVKLIHKHTVFKLHSYGTCSQRSWLPQNTKCILSSSLKVRILFNIPNTLPQFKLFCELKAIC